MHHMLNLSVLYCQFIRECQEQTSSVVEVDDDEDLAENATLQLLLSWKNLLVTITKYKVCVVTTILVPNYNKFA